MKALILILLFILPQKSDQFLITQRCGTKCENFKATIAITPHNVFFSAKGKPTWTLDVCRTVYDKNREFHFLQKDTVINSDTLKVYRGAVIVIPDQKIIVLELRTATKYYYSAYTYNKRQ
jgi:hypothetical protein